MKPPSRLRIGPYDYQVHCSEADIHRMEVETRSSLAGAEISQSSEIVLNPKCSPGQLRDTLLHEVQHACYHMSGRGDEEMLTVEEAIRALTAPLLDTLQRNAELRRFLFEEE